MDKSVLQTQAWSAACPRGGTLLDNDETICVKYANGGFGASGPDLVQPHYVLLETNGRFLYIFINIILNIFLVTVCSVFPLRLSTRVCPCLVSRCGMFLCMSGVES